MSPVPSKMDAVKVYALGATVSRVIDLEMGTTSWPREVEIAPLPLSLVDSTVRLRVESIDDGAELEAHGLRVGLYAPPKEKVNEPVEDKELRELERALRLKRELLLHVEGEMEVLGGIQVPDRPHGEEGKPPPPSPITARVALEQFTQNALDKRAQERKALRANVDELERKLAELQDRMSRMSSARQVSAQEISKCVTARLHHHGKNFTKARLVLEYFVPGARWAPAYQCRLTRDCQKADLQQRALICQRSGEDWKGVKLTLSTAAPMRWTEIPELASVRVGRAQPPPPPKAGFRPPPQGAGALFQDFDRDRATLARQLPPRRTWSGGQPVELQDHDTVSIPASVRAAAAKGAHMTLMRAESVGGSGAGDDVFAQASEDAFEETSADYETSTPPEGAMAMAPPPPPPPPPPRAPMAAKMAPAAAAKPAAGPPAKRGMRLGDVGEAAPEVQSLDDFTLLRLSTPDDSTGRARLRALDSRSAYLESLAKAHGEVPLDVMALVSTAHQEAAAAAAVSLPRGAVNVRSAAGEAFDFSYSADGVVEVASDGQFHSVALGTRTADAEVQYVVVPREDSNVYRTAVIKNPIPAPLLSGPAEIYVGGEYVLTTNLPTVRPRGEITLGLGVEQSIKCARNTQFKEERSGSKVVAMNELWHDVTIQLVNGLERDISCEVRERIPQPAKGAEVVVEEGAVSPAWEAYDQRERGAPIEGGRKWKLRVPSKGEMTLKAQYVVKIYANNEIAGGNRREA